MGCVDEETWAKLRSKELAQDEQDAMALHTRTCDSCATRLADATVRLDMNRSDVPTSEPVSDPLANVHKLGRYHILERLAAGGMGVIYAAYDPELDRRVAIKLLHTGHHGSTGRSLLLREAQALARLTHPNVTAIYDVGTFAETVFFAMELVDGETMRQWFDTKPSWREIIDVFAAAGDGLAAAHAAGMVHRDFKPSNVLISKNGQVKVTDFGVARIQDLMPIDGGDAFRSTEVELTLSGQVVGTVGYMAPEQLEAQPATPSSDQFGLCVGLYRALYGRQPFRSRTVEEYTAEVRHVPVPPRGAKVPAWLRRVVLRGLAKRPEERFASMDELVAVLRRGRRQTRRRANVASVLATVAVATVAITYLGQTRAERLCGTAADQSVWTAQRRAVVSAALGVHVGTSTSLRVVDRLDRYLEGWGLARFDVCAATRLRDEQPEAVRVARMSCLDRRLEAVDAAVALLAVADPMMVDYAGSVAAQLPSLEECNDLSAIRHLTAPIDLATTTRSGAARRRLARGWTLLHAGQLTEGLALAHELTTETDAIGYAPLQIEARLLLGNVEQWGDAPELAVHNFERAVEMAVAAHDDADAARALALLAFAEARTFVGPTEVQRIVRWADAFRSRLGSDDTAAFVASWTGNALINLGQRDESEPRIEYAIALARRLGDDWLLALSLEAKTIALAMHGDDTATLANIMDTLAAYDRIAGPGAWIAANSIHNAGYLLWRQGRASEALPYLSRAVALARSHPAQAPLNTANLFEDLGKALVDLDRLDDGFALRREALALIADHPEAHTSTAEIEAGYSDSLRRANHLVEALTHAEHAVAACDAETIKRSPEECARAHFALAQVATKQARIDELVALARAEFTTATNHRQLRELEEWYRTHASLPVGVNHHK